MWIREIIRNNNRRKIAVVVVVVGIRECRCW